MTSYRIISSDDHVVEPPDLWTAGIESRYRERAPHVVRQDGIDWWVCDDTSVTSMGPGAQAGRRFEEPENLTRTDVFENVRPGGYIPGAHIKDMDVDGVDVSVLYPTVGLFLYRVPDGELASALFRVYNDWLAQFCISFPDRLKGIAMINADDVSVGIRELERCAHIGLVGAMISVYPPEERSYNSPEYEGLWEAAEGLGIPLSLHISTNRPSPGKELPQFVTQPPAFMCNVDYWVRMSLAHIILSGVLERHPRLQVGSVEQETSWVPFFLDRLDYTYTQRAPNDLWYQYKEDMLPSDYFHRNVFVGFQEDAKGISDRHIIGVDNLLWGSDYPHQESTFPRSREILEEIMAECTEDEKAKIAGGNAARIYHLD